MSATIGRPAIALHAGQQFGRLTVLERAGNRLDRPAWRCHCECGVVIVAQGKRLASNTCRVRSCGCLKRDLARAAMLRLHAAGLVPPFSQKAKP